MSTEAPVLDREELVGRLEALRTEKRRRRYLTDGASWVEEVLGEYLWSKQREIFESVRKNPITVVKSCHGPGKSFVGGRIITHWIATRPVGQAAAVSTAPTDKQVRLVLWKEINRAHARGQLLGRMNQKEWHVQMPDGHDEVVAFGSKPADYDPAAFQGSHERFMLVVVDEANGVPDAIIEAVESLLTNDDCRLLLIGNPIVPDGLFYKYCQPGSGASVITISAFDTPNFTDEDVPARIKPYLVGRTYVERARKRWAPDWRWSEDGRTCLPPESDPKGKSAHPFWHSKVLGEFCHSIDPQALIPMRWVHDAQNRDLEPGLPNELGVDVGAGGDSSTICQRRGSVFRILHEDHEPDTMKTCGNVVLHLRKTGATVAKIDQIGIGTGITNRGRELKEPFVGISVGMQPFCTRLSGCARQRIRAVPNRQGKPIEVASDGDHDKMCGVNLFVNLKAQLWWQVRERFETGEIDLDPEDDDTAGELVSLKFFVTSSGEIQIESKQQAKNRGVASPNRAEALMLANAETPVADTLPSAGVVF